MPPKPTLLTSCTAQFEDGQFCDRKTLPDAPFPICLKHASQLYAFLQATVHDVLADVDPPVAAVEAYLSSRGAARATRFAEAEHVVYYVKVDSRIKIGTSTSVHNRIRAYPPGSLLLATEPGDREVERQRHFQFRAYRVAGREWFWLGDDLREHINQLRAADGAAALKAS